MALLSDSDIAKILIRDRKEWAGFADRLGIVPFNDELITPVGYDLTLGEGPHLVLQRDDGRFTIRPGETLRMRPGDTVLLTTEEWIGLPRDGSLAGIIQSKVSQVSRGFSHISTTVDNDWHGPLVIAMTNVNSIPLDLHRGDPICTLMFLECATPATVKAEKLPGRSDVLVAAVEAQQQHGKFVEAERQRVLDVTAASMQRRRARILRILTTAFTTAFMPFFAWIGQQTLEEQGGWIAGLAIGASVAVAFDQLLGRRR